MAVYFLRAQHISRGKGGRVTYAAAYRAGERILDTRTSETHDYSHRLDIPYKEVVLPADLAGRPDMAWTQDRSTLWNAAEHAGPPQFPSRSGMARPHPSGSSPRRSAPSLSERLRVSSPISIGVPSMRAFMSRVRGPIRAIIMRICS